jgi:N6-adenosine-specific RNA methylase IME4
MDALVKIDAAKQALAEAQDINAILEIRDKAAAMSSYAHAKGAGEAAQMAKELQIRAERKAGEWLRDAPKHPGKRTDLVASSNQVDKPTLSDLGIEKTQSHRWQAIASLPNEEFEKHIAETKDKGEELTSVGTYRYARQTQRIEEPETTEVVVPEGEFSVIVVDPPWPYKTPYDPIGRRTASPYAEMELEEISELVLPFAQNSVLWLWTTHKFLKDAFGLLETWGFEYKLCLAWNKEHMGIGRWLRCQIEFCLLGIKGRPKWVLSNERDFISEPRREHSRKPDAFYSLVEQLCPGPLNETYYLDVFSREKREGWAQYGNEPEKFQRV